MEKDKIAGLILAAGFSSRMGTFKPLLQIDDLTAIEQVASTLKKAGIKKIIGVTGFQRERLTAIFDSAGIIEAYNPDFEQGMFTSIKAGLKKASELFAPNADASGSDTACSSETPGGFFLMLVDCPLVPSEVFDRILRVHEENPEVFIVPCYRGKKGHPLFIPASYSDEILAHEGEGGLKAITNRHEDKLIRLETDTEAVVLDMDTPEGYREILEFYNKTKELEYGIKNPQPTGAAAWADSEAQEELKGKRLFLVRHGEIRQHREKIFLGQTDVPLSEKGKVQAEEAADELVRCKAGFSRIYASDLTRAVETAEIIGNRLGQSHALGHGHALRQSHISGQGCESQEHEAANHIRVITEPLLREMDLGAWDGCYVSDIREKYPEELQKRGENLLTYKFGNDSENFFDLRYRAMKGLKAILKREREIGDESSDIVIVAHAGIIGTIVSSLRGTDLEAEIRGKIPNGGIVLIDIHER
jgi:Fructose-2,6-bisphosphatase